VNQANHRSVYFSYFCITLHDPLPFLSWWSPAVILTLLYLLSLYLFAFILLGQTLWGLVAEVISCLHVCCCCKPNNKPHSYSSSYTVCISHTAPQTPWGSNGRTPKAPTSIIVSSRVQAVTAKGCWRLKTHLPTLLKCCHCTADKGLTRTHIYKAVLVLAWLFI